MEEKNDLDLHAALKSTEYMMALHNAITVKALPSLNISKGLTIGLEVDLLLFDIMLYFRWIL